MDPKRVHRFASGLLTGFAAPTRVVVRLLVQSYTAQRKIFLAAVSHSDPSGHQGLEVPGGQAEARGGDEDSGHIPGETVP